MKEASPRQMGELTSTPRYRKKTFAHLDRLAMEGGYSLKGDSASSSQMSQNPDYSLAPEVRALHRTLLTFPPVVQPSRLNVISTAVITRCMRCTTTRWLEGFGRRSTLRHRIAEICIIHIVYEGSYGLTVPHLHRLC